jgi:hypothetical protein
MSGSTLYLSHGRGPKEETPALSYFPLDEDKDEIRLITFTNESNESDLVHCNLETVSLKFHTPEYRKFESTLGPRVSKRKVLDNWAHLHYSSGIRATEDQDATKSRVPAPECYRFLWGDYAALSYVWGDENTTRKIIVNRQETQVTRNLEVALRALRGNPVFQAGYKLWVDALCINQTDYKERDQQIGKMQNIYGNAWAVIAWLGEEEDESDQAIGLLEALSSAGRKGCAHELEAKLTLDPEYLGNGSWLALHELMNRPYWTRLWIIQEIVLGSSGVIIRCGDSLIDWKTFCSGIRVLSKHLWIAKDWLLEREMALRKIPGERAWLTTSLHLVDKDLRVLSHYEEEGGGRLGFGRLLEVANSASSRNIRDKVYGLVGMMDPVIAERLAPDYRMDPSGVFASVAKAFILTYGNLEPLRESNPWGKNNTPSWAADWTWNGRVRYSRPEVPVWGPFWNQDDPAQGIAARISYRASGNTPPIVSFSDNDLYLICRGFAVDSIAGLSSRGSTYFSWLERSIVQPDHRKSAYGGAAETARALYIALVADRVGNEQRASDRHAAILSLPSTFDIAEPQFRKLGWNWLSGQGGYYFRWERWRLANERFWLGDRFLGDYFTDRIPENASEYDYTEVYSCFDRTCKGRRFMATSKGYLGWAPDNIYGSDEDQTRKGDLIVIIFGCSTPIVIRPRGEYYEVVGEAYAQGLMDGEAMMFLESGDYRIQDFTFC